MGNHDACTDALSSLRKAAKQFEKAKDAFDEARPYAKRSPDHGGQAYIDAAAALHACRDRLRHATVHAVHSGVSQAEASRISGISRAQVSRLSRGATSGRDVIPPAVYLVNTLPAERIAERYRNGESAVELADAYGCGDYTIRYLLKRMGVPLRKGNSVELPVPNEELARRYVEDRTMLKDMAAEFGVTPDTISRRLEDVGIHVPLGQRRMELPTAEIVRRYQEGETVAALARSYGVSFPTIAKRLRENGEKRRRSQRKTRAQDRP